VLAADGRDDAVADEVIAELGQRPASVGQAQFAGGLLGQTPDGAPLRRGQSRRCSQRPPPQQSAQAAAVEQTQIGVDGVDVDTQQSSHVLGRVARGMQQRGFQASALPGAQRLLQQAMKLVEFLRRGRVDPQGAGHGLSSSSAPLFHSNNPLVTNSYILSVTPRLTASPDL
jgi:hypothetical protein